MKHMIIILIAILALVSACSPDSEMVACTKEAKICPDGSAVGRNGSNNCEFDPCPEAPAGESCVTSADCPNIVCVKAPCAQSVCVDGYCEMEKCATYGRNGTQVETCAACGDGICNEYEYCVPSLSNDEIATADCGELYCPADCRDN